MIWLNFITNLVNNELAWIHPKAYETFKIEFNFSTK